MNDLELMYRIIDAINSMNYPIVFKGALVLKHIMVSHGITSTFRGTKDIDCDWVDGAISMDALGCIVSNAVSSLNIPTLSVRKVRDADTSGNRISASFAVLDNGVKLFTMDISLKANVFTTEYVTNNGLRFTGASLYKIIVDKLSAVSTDKVKRRTKDIYDLYLISFLPNIRINEIMYVGRESNRELSDFDWFLSNKKDIEYAYMRMRGIHNKPDFNIMYNRVRDFCIPFITRQAKSNLNAVWVVDAGVWYPYYGN